METALPHHIAVNGSTANGSTANGAAGKTAISPATAPAIAPAIAPDVAAHVVSKGARTMSDIIRVSSQSRSTAVAGAIAGIMRRQGYAEVQAIGAPAVNQAVKAITIARSYLEQDGMDLVIVPSFYSVAIDEQERTAIHFTILRRPDDLAAPPR